MNERGKNTYFSYASAKKSQATAGYRDLAHP